jgi:acetylornithine deacetylase
VIIKYPGVTDKIVSFVGSHLDVVPASPSSWERDPFTLFREGDLLFGRGTTDCLGHVAMLTDFFATLAEAR